ncbi:(2Fe-2S) ferredoxin domain-containing protein [Streptomyces sp. MI02-7b]|uniref:(2Fe-2S) ferredoxin domain-containing protein n=1 Tax=Streptomyces sp. MI02-7b TaxID=462941 RepID=UPI0029A7A739|nr:(2Fe-2S) ferredoxin domain-containing protein [Streptomyces sp. MI02-7b]MDX3075782.1 (2Fe-2S) ferredoxin domain-containing protein [Streptomyces sp. MI02-7b]
MSHRHKKGTTPTGPVSCTVTVCRGCCCGTLKVPGIDHAEQLAALRRAMPASGKVRVTDCLDACEHANVTVVQPSAEGRRRGGRPVWLGLVNDPGTTADITTWIEASGPGLAEPPGILDLYTFKPSRRIQAELHDE